MKRLLLAGLLVLVMATSSLAVPLQTAEYNSVPQRGYSPALDYCHIQYYNICSGWVFYWTGYCYGEFEDNQPVRYGTLFDLDDCDPDCRTLVDVWWAAKTFTGYGRIDIEILCPGDPGGNCPWPPPIVAIYGYVPDPSSPWQHFHWTLDEAGCYLCEDAFLVLITDWTAGVHTSPYTDHVPLNVEAGCQDWRCTGHSFVYKNVVDYCLYYGTGAPMWVSGPDYGCSNVPPIPPGCHNYSYPTGVAAEFLIDCYVACIGVSPAENNSWSEIKALFR